MEFAINYSVIDLKSWFQEETDSNGQRIWVGMGRRDEIDYKTGRVLSSKVERTGVTLSLE